MILKEYESQAPLGLCLAATAGPSGVEAQLKLGNVRALGQAESFRADLQLGALNEQELQGRCWILRSRSLFIISPFDQSRLLLVYSASRS